MTLFKKCSRHFDPSINMALVNWGFSHYRDMKKFLKNLLLRNCWSDFEIISQECSLCDPFQKVFAKFDLSINKYGSGEWGLFALYGHEEILKKLFSPKPLVRFWNNFTGLFLGWPFSKIVCKILINVALWMGAFCTIQTWRNSCLYSAKKSCSQKPLVRFWNNFIGIRFWH